MAEPLQTFAKLCDSGMKGELITGRGKKKGRYNTRYNQTYQQLTLMTSVMRAHMPVPIIGRRLFAACYKIAHSMNHPFSEGHDERARCPWAVVPQVGSGSSMERSLWSMVPGKVVPPCELWRHERCGPQCAIPTQIWEKLFQPG